MYMRGRAVLAAAVPAMLLSILVPAGPANAAVLTNVGKTCETYYSSVNAPWTACAWVNVDTTNHVFRAYASITNNPGYISYSVAAVRNGIQGSYFTEGGLPSTKSTVLYPCSFTASNNLSSRVKSVENSKDESTPEHLHESAVVNMYC